MKKRIKSEKMIFVQYAYYRECYDNPSIFYFDSLPRSIQNRIMNRMNQRNQLKSRVLKFKQKKSA